MRAVEALREFGGARGIGETDLFGPMLCLEECGSNVVAHALRLDRRQTFRVTIEYTDGLLQIELRDRGAEFDPTAACPAESEQNKSAPAAPREEDACGGWGLQLVRRYMDRIQYHRKDGENILTLSKALSPHATQKQFPIKLSNT